MGLRTILRCPVPLAVASLTIACGEVAAPGVPAELIIIDGNLQDGRANKPLPVGLLLEVRDNTGAGVGGVPVTWAVLGGRGSIEPLSPTTDDRGRWTAVYVLGSGLGPNEARFSVEGLEPVVIRANAILQDIGNEIPPPVEARVTVNDARFSPEVVAVPVGGTVTWKWEGKLSHNLVFDAGAPSVPARPPGNVYQYTFASPGLYSYQCTLHGEFGVERKGGRVVVR